ncbi:hypothetical protein ACFROC_04980 [Nocardia tengchongensis]|uniref:hypothetical protein n=1 Tax=Nocardia tengchongensis TaxID=2055889 RepID=UPI0036C47809
MGSNELDKVWRSVRDMLGALAKDVGGEVAAGPAQVSSKLTRDIVAAGDAEVAAAQGFTHSSAARSSAIGSMATPSGYLAGRDLIDVVDYTALRAEGSRSLGRSPTFEKIQRLQGFDGRVSVGSPHEIDAAIAAGGQELFRGFDEDRYVDSFIAGPVRPGGGPTGSGIYVSPLKEVAFDYTDPARTQALAVREARVLRMVLRPDAKTITLRALESDRSRALAQLARDLRAARNVSTPTAADNARYTELLNRELAFADIGQYGALRGWDAIDGSDTWRNKEWAVLNPTALIVQR